MPVEPAVIRGAVPAHYHGPLYYRVYVFASGRAGKPMSEMVAFADRALGERLARVNRYHAALRAAQGLCDERGDLLPDLRQPIRARLKAGATKWRDELYGVLVLVSPRFRDVVEGLAPGAHYFVPLDVDDRAGGVFRAYAFFSGVGRRRAALALEANGIPYSFADTGELVFKSPEWVLSDHFGYLDASVVDGAPLLYDWRLGPLFSAELVELLGNVLQRGAAFVPMGLAPPAEPKQGGSGPRGLRGLVLDWWRR